MALVATMCACAPALDWRELHPEGSQARVMFPCRPGSHARGVVLAGGTVEMSMYACSVDDTTFALSFADVKDPALVGDALNELALALQSHLRSPSPAASEPVRVPGMTPQPQSAQWRIIGRMPDGRAMQERSALFSYGTRVYQATMLGAELDIQAQETFFGALRVGP
jgi:hypothetical protein